jgi:hypothetical protein
MRQSMSYAAPESAGTPNAVQKVQSSPKAERTEAMAGRVKFQTVSVRGTVVGATPEAVRVTAPV